MPRIARTVASGLPHHITQRGNYRQVIFETDRDYLQYREWLKEYSGKYALDIWAYCLMSNHVHFICVPGQEDSLARTFNLLHMRYSQYLNRRRKMGAMCGKAGSIPPSWMKPHLPLARRITFRVLSRMKISKRNETFLM